MSDVYTPPPVAGAEPWDAGLNTTIDWLHRHIVTLETQVAALEARPEYILNSYAWSFNAGAPPATTNGQVRLNNANPALATAVNFRKIDFDGGDRTGAFQMVTVGSQLRINDWDNAAIIHRYVVTGLPTIDATNAQVPVTWISGNGALPTQGQAKVNVAFLIALVL